MAKVFSKTARGMVGGIAAAAFGVILIASDVAAQGAEMGSERFRRDTPSQQGRDKGQYIPTISITPDGCEAWVMDDGAEGYAVNHVTRQGKPVCREVNVCGVLNSDQYFATDSYHINRGGQQRLREFFQNSSAFAFTVIGHTDSRASDDYNMRLSLNRANSVAKVAQSVGARLVDVRGMGERSPVAPNNTVAGMAKNRRVEILCFE
ncbi:OmpA family protein [Aquicoccus porphyridii]|nr:OmpA family protein [Aquicoccus porphyridii]